MKNSSQSDILCYKVRVIGKHVVEDTYADTHICTGVHRSDTGYEKLELHWMITFYRSAVSRNLMHYNKQRNWQLSADIIILKTFVHDMQYKVGSSTIFGIRFVNKSVV